MPLLRSKCDTLNAETDHFVGIFFESLCQSVWSGRSCHAVGVSDDSTCVRGRIVEEIFNLKVCPLGGEGIQHMNHRQQDSTGAAKDEIDMKISYHWFNGSFYCNSSLDAKWVCSSAAPLAFIHPLFQKVPF